METMKKTVKRYELVFHGVFGRNRKEKREFVRLFDSDPTEQVAAVRIDSARKDALANLRVKPGGRWKVTVCDVEIEKTPEATWEKRLLFGATTIDSGEVSP